MAAYIDAKALARFDHSYVRCESRFPEMRGHRDEAYLGLWRVKVDDKSRAELAAARKGKVYRTEWRAVRSSRAEAASAPASSPIEQQCQALWTEAQRDGALKR